MKIKATIDKQELEIEVDEKVLEKAGYVKNKEYKRWRADKLGCYWSIDDFGIVYSSTEYRSRGDNHRYDLGNYFQTCELATHAVKRQLAIVRVNDRIMELNKGREGNSYIDYSSSRTEFDSNTPSIGYINSRVLDNMADEDVANQIISECENDLKIIFGV